MNALVKAPHIAELYLLAALAGKLNKSAERFELVRRRFFQVQVLARLDDFRSPGDGVANFALENDEVERRVAEQGVHRNPARSAIPLPTGDERLARGSVGLAERDDLVFGAGEHRLQLAPEVAVLDPENARPHLARGAGGRRRERCGCGQESAAGHKLLLSTGDQLRQIGGAFADRLIDRHHAFESLMHGNVAFVADGAQRGENSLELDSAVFP